MGKGSPSTQTSTGTTYNTNIPEYAKPYVETMLGATQRQLFEGTDTGDGGFNITGFKPYKPYSTDPADYIAGFSPLQQQVMGEAANMYRPEQFGMASRYADIAGAGGMESADRAYGYGQTGADIGLMGLQAQDYGRQVGDTAQEYARRAAEAGRRRVSRPRGCRHGHSGDEIPRV